MSNGPSLTLQRHLKAAPAKVFRAWTEAAQVVKWMHPSGTEMIRAEIDARVDGRFRIVMRGRDGQEHDASGRYLEVMPDAKLVFTWAWRSTPEDVSRVTVMLKPDGAGTWLTLTHEQFADEAARDDHEEGWSEALDKFERYLG